jgi:hypothetical protein
MAKGLESSKILVDLALARRVISLLAIATIPLINLIHCPTQPIKAAINNKSTNQS